MRSLAARRPCFAARLRQVQKDIAFQARYVASKSGVEEEDAAQELRLVAWRAHRRYRPGLHASFRTYAYCALQNGAKNILAAWYRKAMETVPIEAAPAEVLSVASPAAEVESEHAASQLRSLILAELRRAAPRRNVLEVFRGICAGDRPTEVARALGISYSRYNAVVRESIRPAAAAAVKKGWASEPGTLYTIVERASIGRGW